MSLPTPSLGCGGGIPRGQGWQRSSVDTAAGDIPSPSPRPELPVLTPLHPPRALCQLRAPRWITESQSPLHGKGNKILFLPSWGFVHWDADARNGDWAGPVPRKVPSCAQLWCHLGTLCALSALSALCLLYGDVQREPHSFSNSAVAFLCKSPTLRAESRQGPLSAQGAGQGGDSGPEGTLCSGVTARGHTGGLSCPHWEFGIPSHVSAHPRGSPRDEGDLTSPQAHTGAELLLLGIWDPSPISVHTPGLSQELGLPNSLWGHCTPQPVSQQCSHSPESGQQLYFSTPRVTNAAPPHPTFGS